MIEPALAWWRVRLDGDWEHRYGFKLETADNPGIILTLDPGGRAALALGSDRIVMGDLNTWEIRVRAGTLVGFAVPGYEAEMISRSVELVENLPDADRQLF